MDTLLRSFAVLWILKFSNSPINHFSLADAPVGEAARARIPMALAVKGMIGITRTFADRKGFGIAGSDRKDPHGCLRRLSDLAQKRES